MLDGCWTASKRDAFITRKINMGEIRAYITVPFISTVSVHAQDSTINDVENTGAMEHLEFMRLFRESLYVDADVDALHKTIVERGARHQYKPRLEIFSTMLQHHLSYVDEEVPSYFGRSESLDD